MKHHVNEKITAGKHIPVWLYDTLPAGKSEQLTANIETEVVIIGGGISGLTIAYCLLKEGKKVVLLEDGYIGSGETGHTTAHLTNALDDRYYHLAKVFGEKESKLIAESHTKAIALIEQIIHDEKIDCNFKRLNGYLFLDPTDKKDALDRELEAATKAGLDVKMKNSIPGIKQWGSCIEFSNQARFHPMKYLSGLFKAVKKMGGEIYTETRAEQVDSGKVTVRGGFTVKAKDIVVATNTPFNDKVFMHMKQYAYRTYVIGAKIPKGSLEDALWWDTGDFEINDTIPPYHYVRLQELDETHDLLICGGEDHATGMADADHIPEERRYEILEAWAQTRFDIGEVIYRWSGQVMEPMDSLAYIGHTPMGDPHTYIVTGDSGNGMTHANIAGMLITDLIMKRENPWKDLYSPSRMKWTSTGGVFLKEFVGGFFSYLKHQPDTNPEKAFSLQKDHGAVVKWNGKTCGLFRDNDDTLHVVDATCTHLGCTVKFNNDEKSWDCPCHGSRFTVEGKVMNGPAVKDLEHHREEFPKRK